MQNSEVYKELNKFRKFVINESKKNLRKYGKGGGKLESSLNSELKVNPNSFELSFSMEDYGVFQDQGVKGADPSRVSPNAKIKGQQAPNSQFKFGSGSKSGTWNVFIAGLEKWARIKNIRLRDEKGRYKKGNYKSIAQIIGSNIYARGLKPSLFFTKTFEEAYKKLQEELVKKYGLDAIKLFNEQTDQILKQNA